MRKSLAKIYFDSKPCDRDLLKMEWRTATIDQKPNNWSIRIIFVEELQADNSVLAEIDFLVEDANYLLAPGAKFKLFGLQFNKEVFVDVIKEI